MIEESTPHRCRRECECGNPKSDRARVCDRCRFLDGGSMTSDTIHALRDCGTVTLQEVAEYLGRHESTMRGSLRSLVRRGRATWRRNEQGVVLYSLTDGGPN